MGNYFDNQDKWSWYISDKGVMLITDHGSHTHTLDLSNVSIGDMFDNTGQVMGDAHRAVPHDYKAAPDLPESVNAITPVMDDIEQRSVNQSFDCVPETSSTSITEDNPLVVEGEGCDNSEGCDDGLDI